MNNKAIAVIAAIVGVLFLIVAVMYATQQAGSLPSFFPGFKAGSHDKHMKHAILAGVVGAACFIFGWFLSGNKAASSASTGSSTSSEPEEKQ